MDTIISICTNSALLSIVLLCILCLKKVNVLLAIILCSIIAGLFSGMNIKSIMDTFINGMGGNAETALSYILLGAFAATMSHSGFANILSLKISNFVSGKKYTMLFVLCLIAMASQNLVPIHIAFIPILIPPLLGVMNKLKIDRRSVACVLAFGLKMPYIAIPAGFGLIFQSLIADNMVQNGVYILKDDIWKYNIILGLGMTIGLLTAVFVSYRKPRAYKENPIKNINSIASDSFNYKHMIVILAAISAFAVQLITKSLPLGALVGLGIMFTLKVVSNDKVDYIMNEGIYLMGYVAFVMLAAAGYADIIDKTGAVEQLINNILPYLPHSVMLTSIILLILGLFITIGIGSSFGTIPIIAVLFIPICLKTGFNPAQIAILIAASAALGDAGSPASDTTLGPTSGLNADGEHNHIFDTCIPTFIHYNTALIIFALIGIYLFK